MMRQLTELDASFLYLESENSPMHMGGLYLFDNSDREKPLDFEEFRRYIESRLHLADFFRQRLIEVPLHLDHPYWVDDPDFDLDRHLRHVTLEKPGDEPALLELAASLLAEPLPRDRPLWEISFIDGLAAREDAPSSFAILVKVHHAAIDAATGEEVMGALLEFSPTPRSLIPPQPWRPKPLPSKARLLGGAYGSALNTPFRLASLAKDTLASAFYAVLVQRLRKLKLPPALFSAPRTLFNLPIGRERVIGYVEFPLERFRKLKKAHSELTVNDLVLATCAEALSSYLASHGRLPRRPLIAMSPISVRSKNLRSPTGKQLSAMLISLATDEPDLARRLKKIHDNAVASKIYGQAISAARLRELIPSSMVGLSARIYTEFQLAQRHRPLFNLPITNVPGPQIPLYLNGAKLIRQIGTAPLFDGLGLVLVIVSYNSKITISVTSSPSVLTDMDNFLARFPEALENMEKALDGVDLASLPETEAGGGQTLNRPATLGGAITDMVSLFSNLFESLRHRSER